MKCEYCGAEIAPGTEVMFEGHIFCNSLHRKWWSDHGIGVASHSSTGAEIPAKRKLQKGKLIGLITTALFVAVGSYVGSRFAGGLFGSGINSQLVKVSDRINQHCPMMVDAETRLDNTSAGVGKTIVYNYTILGLTRDQIDTVKLRSKLEPRMINNMETNPQMKYFRDNGVTTIYSYSDKNGVFVMDIKVTPADYR